MSRIKVYTRTGDDGTTGLLFGGRVAKNAPAPSAYGDVDELQAHLGVARAANNTGVADAELEASLLAQCRDLWVLMAELATAPENRHKLTDGASRVDADMVHALEDQIDRWSDRFEPPTEFVVPGANPLSASLDVARTVARRAERSALAVAADGSLAVAYLNRLSDLLWTLARAVEGESLLARDLADGAADSPDDDVERTGVSPATSDSPADR